MGIYGLKQLCMWSLEHACLDDQEYARTLAQWKAQWDTFLEWLVAEYGESEQAKM